MPRKRLPGWLWILPAGFTTLKTLEETNTFCGSCHTQPESTYLERLIAAPAVDLASAHQQAKPAVRCIDCHSGAGLTGRAAGMLDGALNAVAFITRTAQQPARLRGPYPNDYCLKCHSGVLVGEADQNNHFHIFLPKLKQANPQAGNCVDCHSTHATDGEVNLGYLNRARTEAVCEQCHNTFGEGG